MKFINIVLTALFTLSLFGCSKTTVPASESDVMQAVDVSSTTSTADVDIQKQSITQTAANDANSPSAIDNIKTPAAKPVVAAKKVERVVDYHFSGFADSPAADDNWSNINIHILNSCDEDEDVNRVVKELKPILQSWNTSRNAHDAKKLAKLFANQVYIRGTVLDNGGFLQKMKSSFEKHKDYKQTPKADVYVNCLEQAVADPIQKWSVRFNEAFVQDDKTTETEIMLGLTRYLTDDDDSTWKFVIESDIASDRSMIRKLGILQTDSFLEPCDELLGYIITESPLFRWKIALNYQAFKDAESMMKFTFEGESYRLYESLDTHNATLEWYEVDLESKTISTMLEARVVIDAQYNKALTELCINRENIR